MIRWLGFLLLVVLIPNSAFADPFEFKIFRGKKPIDGMKIEPVPGGVEVISDEPGSYRINVTVEGEFTTPDNSLLSNLAPIPLDGSKGHFKLKVDARGPMTPIVLTEVSAEGNLVQEELQLVTERWETAIHELKNGPQSRHRITPGFGLAFLNYQQTGTEDFSQVSLSAKATYIYFITPRLWNIELNGYGTVLPLSSSVDGLSLKQLGFNARMGYFFWPQEGSLRVGVSGGLFYTSAVSSNNLFGFSGLAGAQFSPTLFKAFSAWDTGSAYLKLVPLFRRSFADREVAAGFGWFHTVFGGRTYSVSFDFSDIRFKPSDTEQIDSRNLVLGGSLSI